MKQRYYLAYGSNLNLEQMRFRCPGAKVVGTAFIKDYRLLFKGSKTGAYLTIEKAKGYKVPVAVWEVNQENEWRLDQYEGYPRFYYKKDIKVDVLIDDEETIPMDAFVYIMDEDREFAMPSDFYMLTCIQGYDDFRFDFEYLKEAREFTKENCKWENKRLLKESV